MPSIWSGVELARMSPQSPKSTRALARAIAALDSITPALSTAGTVFGMSRTVVTPPAAAAAVRVPKFSFSGNPGSRLCTWTSMAPGRTYMPVASMTFAPSRARTPGSTRVITPSVTWTSAATGPPGVYTMPPRIRSSVKLEVLYAEQRRVRDAGVPNVLLSPFATVEHHHEADHLQPRVAQHLRRSQGVAPRRHHILNHCHPIARRDAALELLRRA